MEVIWFCINPFIKKLKINLTISNSFLASYYCYRKKIPYAIYLHHPPNFLYFKSKEEEKEWVNSPKRFLAWFGGKIIGNWLRRLDKKVVRNAKELFVNSKFTEKRIKKIYGRNAKVIYPTKNDSFKILNIKKKDFIYILSQSPFMFVQVILILKNLLSLNQVLIKNMLMEMIL